MRFARAEGCDLVVGVHLGEERHAFPTPQEASARADFIAEALTWLGTPFVDQGDIKGPGGAVDCAMMMVRCAVDTGRLPAFDPRPYPPRWHLHKSEELFLGWVEKLGARATEDPRPGDLALWLWGRVFSHGGVLINSGEVCHAYYAHGEVVISPRDEPLLNFIGVGRHTIPRAVRYFDLWGQRA